MRLGLCSWGMEDLPSIDIEALWRAAQGGRFDALVSEELPAPSVDDGQTLCLGLLDRWEAEGEQLGGWKLGLTSGRSRDAFGDGIRPFGFILASRIHPSGAVLQRLPGMGVENELCWTLAEPLAGEAVTAADARRAVASVAPAFELNQNRLTGTAAPGLRVADNLSQWGLVVGAALPLADLAELDTLLEELTVTLLYDEERCERVSARGHIDDHFESLARLARELARFGRGLAPGEHVITGAYTRHVVERPGTWRGDFGATLGEVEITFS
jgi:2-keto-4-pentenoate hydratase